VFVNGVSLGRTGDLSKPPSGGCEAYLLYHSFAVPAGVLSASRPNVVAVLVRSGSDASRPGGLYDSMAPDMRSGEPLRPFSSWNRPILTEIYLCHACSCQEILMLETPGQVLARPDRRAPSHAPGSVLLRGDIHPRPGVVSERPALAAGISAAAALPDRQAPVPSAGPRGRGLCKGGSRPRCAARCSTSTTSGTS
jgi:hypothetical protein